jgi:O-antigen ligase
MDFIFLVLSLAALYLAPQAIWPELAELPIYLVVISTCIAFSFRAMFELLSFRSLIKNPITLCVVALIPAILISLVVNSQFYDARVFTWEFIKTCSYYLVLVGVLNTPTRLKTFLWILLMVIVLVTAIGIMDFYEVVRIPGIRQFQQWDINPETGERVRYLRLRSILAFHDPSELGLLLTMGMWITIYLAAQRGAWLFRLIAVGVLAFFAWAFTLAGARGAFTALIAGWVAFLLTRYSRNKKVAIALATIVVTVFFVLFAGRATNVDLAQENEHGNRLDLWSRGIPKFRESPVFGIGADRYFDEIGHQAHNAFWEAYVDLGLVGGTIFLGIFYFAFWGLIRTGSFNDRIPDQELVRLRPYLMAILASHLIGLFTQPLTYKVTIYTVYGLIAAYLRLTSFQQSSAPIEFDRRQVKWLFATSFAFLIGFYVLVRTLERLA